MPRGGGADTAELAPLRQLYRELIRPVRATGLLEGKTRLVIVPHAELHYLPFAALIDDETPTTFLVQRYVVSVTPSAAVWAGARSAPPGGGSGILAMGPRLEQLPGSREEIAGIARLGRARIDGIDGKRDGVPSRGTNATRDPSRNVRCAEQAEPAVLVCRSC